MKHAEQVIDGFSTMLKLALGNKLDPQANRFLEMVSDDIEMEFPYAHEGCIKRIQGRIALEKYLQKVASLIEFGAMSEPLVHHTLNENTVIIEFTCQGRGTKTGNPYDQSYISVITLEQGKIKRYQDYWNPLIIASALGDLSELSDDSGV
ncbi:hypothetical protein MED121_08503 [Marinomonas sp. MED121]|uniref:nuclear transport factor 2 family protein n=1 Tax=Marinomonas sp. MED121 TaxID=314277 RepID=UPI00006900E8|nr:nuclear transport factor 2 family protein [Marinomonas sp. MED121]EAQ65591.1 hypothetical protein MED121_08503 [Marinomonas sp. MED121]